MHAVFFAVLDIEKLITTIQERCRAPKQLRSLPPTQIGKIIIAARRARTAIDFSPRGIRACIAFRNMKTHISTQMESPKDNFYYCRQTDYFYFHK